jgi:hypothetical protein
MALFDKVSPGIAPAFVVFFGLGRCTVSSGDGVQHDKCALPR